jgi:hypothetical protein
MLGIGAIVGTGVFVLTGVAAAEHAGPTLVISFALAALACVFAALCLLYGVRFHCSDIREYLYLQLCRIWRNLRVDYWYGTWS